MYDRIGIVWNIDVDKIDGGISFGWITEQDVINNAVVVGHIKESCLFVTLVPELLVVIPVFCCKAFTSLPVNTFETVGKTVPPLIVKVDIVEFWNVEVEQVMACGAEHLTAFKAKDVTVFGANEIALLSYRCNSFCS